MVVSANKLPLIRIFVGEPVRNRSEHDCLCVAYDALGQRGDWAYIFANFHAAGRQIDLAIFTETTTLVIEAKGYSLPVRGGLNGQWEQLGPFGMRKIGNAYNQALDAKNALRDEIQRTHQTEGYPNGLVAVAPIVPQGSRLTADDFKVAVGGLDRIAQQLTRPSGALLTQELCEELARGLRLEAVGNIDAALDDELLAAERRCQTYLKAFSNFYAPLASELIGDEYSCGGGGIGLSDVQYMAAVSNSGVVIHGPSGCGKTLLATSCAISCLAAGCIPIFVSSKNFDGEFQRLLDKEAALLSVPSAGSIIVASRLLNKRVILFLDGYNECRDDLKASLTRSLKAFALRYGAGIVVSTQHDLVRADILTTTTITVKRPSDELKATLARTEELGDLGENIRSLLRVASSGLEARLVGQAGVSLTAGASKFVLFDTYARKKLDAAAADGIRVLSSFAETLVQRASFSLSVREFDRLCDSTNLEHALRRQVLGSQLLQVRGDRVSFSHELFFYAFSAEAAIRSANGNLARIRAALAAPRLFAAKVFILGAIEDDNIVAEVLDGLTDHDLLAAGFRGECGAVTQSIVKRKIERLLTAMIAEAQRIRFQISGEGWDGISIDSSSLHNEFGDFGCYLTAIGQGLMEGAYLDAVMTACRFMDETIGTYSKAFAAEAKAKKIPLRHAIFSITYVMHREAAISQLINFIHSNVLSFRHHGGHGFGAALRDAWQHAETHGQFYFLLGVAKFSAHGKELAKYVVPLLRNIRAYPYHVQLELIYFAQYLHDVDEPYRGEIIEALEASLNKLGAMMNSIIMDALKGFGTLDEEEQGYIQVVRNELDDALSTDSSEADVAAWGLFSCQFDHPFDLAYWEEIQGLDDSRKKLLFTKACRGANLPYLSFLGILIRELSKFNDPNVAPVIARWTALPDRQYFMPQEALEVFISAHEALGLLGVELPHSRGGFTTPAENALLACGELFYWANRTDIRDPQRLKYSEGARSILLDHAMCASAGALYLTKSQVLSTEGTHISLVKVYPDLCVSICSEALERWESQISFFNHGFRGEAEGIACFAIQVLGNAGGVDHLRLLRTLCDHECLGASALEAIKRIEERTHFRDG